MVHELRRHPGGQSVRRRPIRFQRARSRLPARLVCLRRPKICNPCFADGSTNIPLRLSERQPRSRASPAPQGPACEPGRGDRSVLLRRRLAPGLRDDHEAGARRKRKRRCDYLQPGIGRRDDRSRSRPCRAGRHDDRLGDRGARRLRQRLPGDCRQEDLPPTRPGTSTGTRTCTSQERPTRSISRRARPAASCTPGMPATASRVFFTTTDSLAVGPGRRQQRRPLRGGGEHAGRCHPQARVRGDDAAGRDHRRMRPCSQRSDGNNWNAVGALPSTDSCGVVAIGGGGGMPPQGRHRLLPVARRSSTGRAPGQPNLFVAPPGSAPSFVATLEAGKPLVRDAVQNSSKHVYGDFQVTPDGRYAAFASVRV